MPREITEPTVDEHGYDEHPAFGLIGVSRVSNGGTGGGAVLFDSDVTHAHTVRIRLHTAVRKRDLNRDWHGARRQMYEVEMSEAQWASFVSTVNSGDGVPCTIRFKEGEGEVDGLPYQPRLAESMREVRDAAEKAQREVAAAFAAYSEKKTAANLRTLEAAIRNMPANVTFAAKSLSEHAENVVQRSRADIEAMVNARAQQVGLEPGDIRLPELEA